MRSIALALMAVAVLLSACSVLPPDNSDKVRMTRTIPSGG